MKKNILLILALLVSAYAATGRQLRVLAIGNSFSADAVENHLWHLAAELGDTLTIGNAYIGGCSIDRHVKCLANDLHDYEYRKIVDGQLSNTKGASLHDIIIDEPWDIISLQQVSGLSGRSDSFGNLPVLVDSVTSLMPSKDAELVWHRTWSYAKDYKSDLYPYYGSNQQQMDDSISAVVAKLPFPKIPSGAGVRNAREAFDDSVYRDGYHLALPLGRYIAACVWAEFITGKPVTDCSYVPEGMTPRQASIAREAAHRAIMENTFKH